MSASLVITAVSILVAIVAIAIAWRVSREERRRSAARVAALRAELSDYDDAAMPSDESWDFPTQTSNDARAPFGSTGVLLDAPSTKRSQASIAPLSIVDIDDEVEEAPPVADGMFAAVDRSGARRIHPAMLAVAGAIVLALVGTIATGGREKPQATATMQAAAPTLELLSMRHERDRHAWRITGLVRNPAQNLEVSNVTAVAFLFDRDGTFLGSGRAPLDFARLAPGDEAGFAIGVEVSGQIARYRLSFRAADGTILRHVDRRHMAQNSGE